MGLFDKIDHRADVMTRMADTLQVDFAAEILRDAGTVKVYRQAVLRCAACPHEDECTAWMQDHRQADAAPDYCRNKDILEGLSPA